MEGDEHTKPTESVSSPRAFSPSRGSLHHSAFLGTSSSAIAQTEGHDGGVQNAHSPAASTIPLEHAEDALHLPPETSAAHAAYDAVHNHTTSLSSVQPKVRSYWLSTEPAAQALLQTQLHSPIRSKPPTTSKSETSIEVHSRNFEECLLALGFTRDGGDSHSQLTAPPGLASQLSCIVSLSFVNCNLRASDVLQLPVLPHLHSADLSDNHLTSIGEQGAPEDAYWLAFAPKLKVLRMRGCGLRKIPPLLAASNVEEMDLSCNEISDAAGLDVSLRKLRKLNLAFNAIHTISALRSISLLTSLQELYLHPNPLTLALAHDAMCAHLRNFCPQLQQIDEKMLQRKRAASAHRSPPSTKKVSAVVSPSSDHVKKRLSPQTHAATSALATVDEPDTTTAPIADVSRLSSTNTAKTREEQLERMARLAHPVQRGGDITSVELGTGKWVGNQVLPTAPTSPPRPTAASTKRSPSRRAGERRSAGSFRTPRTSMGAMTGSASHVSTRDGMFSGWISSPPRFPDLARESNALDVSHSSTTDSDVRAWLKHINLRTLAIISGLKRVVQGGTTEDVAAALLRAGIEVPACSLDHAIAVMRSPLESDAAEVPAPDVHTLQPVDAERVRMATVQHISAKYALSAAITIMNSELEYHVSVQLNEVFITSLLVSPIGHLCVGFLQSQVESK